MTQRNSYEKNGVVITPAIPHPNKCITVTYNGLLTESGATDLYAHVGFDREWRREHDYKMAQLSNCFQVDIPIQYADTVNIAFKDGANNWDNNSGHNYTFGVATLR